MKVQKVGENGMKLTTVDVDPKTGEQRYRRDIALAHLTLVEVPGTKRRRSAVPTLFWT